MDNSDFNWQLDHAAVVEGATVNVAARIINPFNRNIRVSGVTFQRGLNVVQLAFDWNIVFDQCVFENIEGEFCLNLINLGGSGHIWFSKCKFRNDVNVEACYGQEYQFNNCTFECDLSFKQMMSSTRVRIAGGPIERSYIIGDLNFSSCNCENLVIRDVVSKKAINFHPCDFESIFIGDGSYNEINFYNYRKLKSFTVRAIGEERNDLTIKKISAPFLTLEGSMLFQNVQISELDFSPFTQNEGTFKFQNVEFTDRLVIKDSDLGRIVFNEIDFSQARICLDNSYLGDCVFSNIKWPIEKKVHSYKQMTDLNFRGSLKNTLILKEVYRQLKNLTKSQSNNIDALSFYRNEMLEYWHEIQIDPKVSIWEKFIVWMSKATSNFGLSLKRPFWLLIAFHSFLFLLMIWQGYDGMKLSFDYYEPDQVRKAFGNFFSLINPVHKYLDTSNGWVVLIDFFMRLFAGFFVYHIIRATRKHAKL